MCLIRVSELTAVGCGGDGRSGQQCHGRHGSDTLSWSYLSRHSLPRTLQQEREFGQAEVVLVKAVT